MTTSHDCSSAASTELSLRLSEGRRCPLQTPIRSSQVSVLLGLCFRQLSSILAQISESSKVEPFAVFNWKTKVATMQCYIHS